MREIAPLIRLYWHTVRPLKPTQIANRLWRRCRPVRVSRRPAPPIDNRVDGGSVRFLDAPKSIHSEDRFALLNRDRRLTFPGGWWDHGESALWGYHLHYFDGLRNTGTDAAVKWALIDRWIEDNGPRRSPGWDPYPISLRVVNWLKWMIAERDWPAPVVESCAHQIRVLEQTLEYHLLANHLFKNAKALLFSGLLFKGDEAERWYRRGFDILEREIPEQFLEDGGHFELSPMYHAQLTEDLLDIVLVHVLMGKRVPRVVADRVEPALTWLATMTLPDGLPALFNDAAFGVAPTLAELARYAGDLGFTTRHPSRGLTYLHSSGYFRYENERYCVIGDVGEPGPPYQPGHAHCDMLSFECAVAGERAIVDTGTSTYEVGPRRLSERGTAAHNNVQVGGGEQSEIWGAFRMGRRAEMGGVDVRPDRLVAHCRSFPPNWVEQRRTFEFRARSIVIEDDLRDDGAERPATARIHFHPDEQADLRSRDELRSQRTKVRVAGAREVRLVKYDYAPEFNVRAPGRVLEMDFTRSLRTEVSV